MAVKKAAQGGSASILRAWEDGDRLSDIVIQQAAQKLLDLIAESGMMGARDYQAALMQVMCSACDEIDKALGRL